MCWGANRKIHHGCGNNVDQRLFQHRGNVMGITFTYADNLLIPLLFKLVFECTFEKIPLSLRAAPSGMEAVCLPKANSIERPRI